MSTRREDIDRAKGLAILLVVFGHLVARQDPAGVHWYEPLRYGIYLFHMPFFLYLSGYVAFLSGAARTPLARWSGLTKRRAQRLLVPFLLFGATITAGKLLAARLVQVDNVPAGLLPGLADLVWNTGASPALSVWYLLVLFVYSVGTPPLLALAGGRAWRLLPGALLLVAVPLPAILYLDRIGLFAVFFLAGGLAAEAGAGWTRPAGRFWPLALALLAGAILLAEAASPGPFAWRFWLLLCGLLAMPALHGLVLAPGIGAAALARLGRLSFPIYLFNTIFIGLAKGLMLKLLSWDGAHFALYAALLPAAGLAGPILLKRTLLWRIPALDRMTG